MANPPRYPDTGDVPDRESPPRTPRWVMIAGIIALILALLFVVMMVVGGGHGPGRHLSGMGLGGATPLSIVTVQSLQ
jgi:hypothetical protein